MAGMDLEIYFYGLIGSFPALLVCLAGAAMCVFYARRNPQASVLVAVALAISLATRVVLPFASNIIFSQLAGLDEIKLRVALQYFVYSIPNALIWVLILWAVFKTTPRDARPSVEFLLQQEAHQRNG